MYKIMFWLIWKNPLSQKQTPLGRKIKTSTPIQLPPSSPKKYDFAYGEHFDFILPDLVSKPIEPHLYESIPASMYGNVEYNPEFLILNNLTMALLKIIHLNMNHVANIYLQFSSTSAIPSIVSQLQKKNKKIKSLEIVLNSYRQPQEEKDLLTEEYEENNE